MADQIRNAVISVDWKMNTSALAQANQLTDELIEKGVKVQKVNDDGARSIQGAASKYKNLSSNVNSATKEVDSHSRAIGESSNKVTSFSGKSKAAFQGASSSAREASETVRKFNETVTESTSKAAGLGDKLKGSFSSAKNQVTGLIGQVKNLATEFKNTASNTGSAIEKGINKPISAVKGIATGLLAGAGVAGAGALFNAGMDRLSSIEDAQMSMEVMMGGDKKSAKGFMDEILAFAKTTPYAFTQLSTSAKNLFAYGMDQKDIVPTLKAIGDLSAASGKGSEGIDSLASAFGKMQVSGKASNEQLTQITEAGVPALKILANQAGKSVDEIRKDVSDGKVSAKEAIDGLVKGIAEGTDGVAGKTQALGGVMEKLKQTWKGSLDSMKSSVTSTMATLVEPAKPHIQKGMAWFGDQFKKLPDIVSTTGKYLQPLWEPTQKIFEKTNHFFKDEFIPTAKTLGKTMGPGFLEGAKVSIEAIGWTIDNVVKPPLLWIREYAEKNPEKMKSIAKYAGIAVTGLLGFKLVESPLMGVTKKVLGLSKATGQLAEKLGSSALNKLASFGGADESAGLATKLKSSGKFLFQGASPVAQGSGTLAAQSLAAESALKGGGALSKLGLATSKFSTTFKNIGGLKGFGKAIPGISYLSAGLNLIGTNKDNVGHKVGGSAGQLAGGGVGAIIGSAIFPGIGTAIGGIIGTYAGQFFGEKFGDSIQKNWDKVKAASKIGWEFAKKFPATAVGANIAEGIVKGSVKAFNATKEFFADPFKDAGKVSAKKDGISKDSAKNVNSYLDENNKVESAKMQSKVTGELLSVEDFNSLMSSYDKMSAQVTDGISAKHEKNVSSLNKLQNRGILSSGTVDSAKNIDDKQSKMKIKAHQDTTQKIKELETKQRNETISATQQFEDRINAIKKAASDEKRALTQQELRSISALEDSKRAESRAVEKKYTEELNVLQEQRKTQAVEGLSASAKEQIKILGKLESDSSKLSAKQAASVVEASYKSRQETVKNAENQYKDTISILEEQRFVYGNITQEQYEAGVQAAKEERDRVVAEAESRHNEVVRHAKEQAQGHLNEVDWETGETLSKWDQFKGSFFDKIDEIKSGAMDKWNNFKDGMAAIWVSITNTAQTAWNGFTNILANAVNKVIGGINAVLKFFDAKTIPEWHPGGGGGSSSNQSIKVNNSGTAAIAAADGLNYNYQGPALVGEQGVELAYNPSKASARLLGENGPQMTHVESGERILNHRQTMSVLSGGLGSGATLPGFADGKGNDKSIVEKATDFIGAGIDKAKDIADTAMDWLSDPKGKVKELVDKNNPFKEVANISGLGFGAMKKVGSSAMEWVSNKLAEFGNFFGGGEAAGAGAYAPHFPNPPFVLTSGMGPRWGTNHNGYDFGAPMGTPLPAQHPGKVSYAGTASGYGNLVAIQVANDLHTLYGHMNSISTSVGKAVKSGQIIGQVGSTGNSTGPHVHYQLNKGGVFGSPLDPMTYGAVAQTVGLGTGGAVERWRPVIMKALAMNGLPTTAAYVNAWLRQVQTESGGNEKITQSSAVWDINTASGNPARGLLQTIPQTFNAYKHPGYNDIYNGFHNALAAINYAKNRYGAAGMLSVIGHGHGYAKGGRPSKGETVLVGENGPELFEADTAGTVHSYEKTQGLFKNASKGINYSPTINIEINGDGGDGSVQQQIKDAVNKVLEEHYRKLKSLLNLGGV